LLCLSGPLMRANARLVAGNAYVDQVSNGCGQCVHSRSRIMLLLQFVDAPAASRRGPQAIVAAQAASDRQTTNRTARPEFQAAPAAPPAIGIENAWRRPCAHATPIRRHFATHPCGRPGTTGFRIFTRCRVRNQLLVAVRAGANSRSIPMYVVQQPRQSGPKQRRPRSGCPRAGAGKGDQMTPTTTTPPRDPPIRSDYELDEVATKVQLATLDRLIEKREQERQPRSDYE